MKKILLKKKRKKIQKKGELDHNQIQIIVY